MDTHAALVISPMNMNISLGASPFRVYFPRSKAKHTADDLEMWGRIRANGVKGGGGVTTSRLSPDEYGEILRDDLKCDEALVAGHLKMVDVVKGYGNVGMNFDLFKVGWLLCRVYPILFILHYYPTLLLKVSLDLG